MYDLQTFTLRNMSECGLALRELGSKADSMEVVGNAIVQYLYNQFIDAQTQQHSAVLIRLFKTHSYGDLPPALQTVARQYLDQDDISPTLKCLTLLATAGEQAAWNYRQQSNGHQAIPLANKTAIASIPMVSQLITQLGIDPGVILQPDPTLIVDIEQQLYNIFYVSQALGSPYIPAQEDFIIPFGIKSVVGFGGLLPSGNMFAVIMFLKVPIPRETLDLIRPLALSVKMAILPFDAGQIFADWQPSDRVEAIATDETSDHTVEQLQSQIATLKQLLNVSEQATLTQSDRLEQAITELKQTLRQLQKTQTQMIHQEKMSALGQMVAGMAHEINNPVNFIYGNINHTHQDIHYLLDLLKLYQHYYPNPTAEIQSMIVAIDLDFIEEDLPQMIASMKMGAERIRTIVQSLRNFSRLDESNYKFANLHEGIDSTLLILHHRLKIKSDYSEIQIIKHYGSIPEVECCPGQLNQVFMNLISNAIEALEEQPQSCPFNPNQFNSNQTDSNQAKSSNGNHQPTGKWIQIDTQKINRDRIQIRIADNGPGMSAAVYAQLFEPFFTTKPIGKGTGIGLSISHQIIVENHAGTLKCHSVPGQGTEFIIELPIFRKATSSNLSSDASLDFSKNLLSEVSKHSLTQLSF